MARDPVTVLTGGRLPEALEEEMAELPGAAGRLMVQESSLGE